MAKATPKPPPSAADQAFNQKLQHLLSRKPDEPVMTINPLYPRGEPLDMGGIVKVFNQYGTYLELIGGDAPVEQVRVFTATRTKIGASR